MGIFRGAGVGGWGRGSGGGGWVRREESKLMDECPDLASPQEKPQHTPPPRKRQQTITTKRHLRIKGGTGSSLLDGRGGVCVCVCAVSSSARRKAEDKYEGDESFDAKECLTVTLSMASISRNVESASCHLQQ